MIQSKQEEEAYLQEVQGKLQTALTHITERIDHYSKEILEIKRYIYQSQSELDGAEKAANRIAVTEDVIFGEKALRERVRVEKLIQSPYFGRIDVSEDEQSEADMFYIGVHSFIDPDTYSSIIFDWRAPISSIFYDFENGDCSYIAPMGKIDGFLQRKRQYKIKETQMEYMIESSLNIGDDILQKELSLNSDDKMKNIVATIQREQNAIIRNEEAKVLIIQGAAGSGKTSIALHRVAFLLYRYKDTLTSNDIAIISPNKVFGNYISNVLPELGEENILEISFETIAMDLLGFKQKYQSFSAQVESLLAKEDPLSIERIQYKATTAFVSALADYLKEVEDSCFQPTDLHIGNLRISKEVLSLSYKTTRNHPIKQRLRKIADDIIERHKRKTNQKVDSAVARQVRLKIEKMFSFSDSISLYRSFYKSLAREDLFCMLPKNELEFSDVYPLIYVKMFLGESVPEYKAIQHLLVDEMQDYTPIQYAVLSNIFACNMTILGDSYQSVNPYSSSSIEKIQPYFAGCISAELCKSYRSTIEITNFTQKIIANNKIIPIERHGKAPTLTICQTKSEQTQHIQQQIDDFIQSDYVSLGIICKSQTQASELFQELHALHAKIHLLDFDSNVFQEGIVLTSVHMAKGLEFDQVIVPDVSLDSYQTPLERSLLYIACTRAMHQLDLYCYKAPSVFLAETSLTD